MADPLVDPTQQPNSTPVPPAPTLESIGGVQPYTGTQRFTEGEMDERAKITKWDKFKESFGLAHHDSAVGTFGQEGALIRSFSQWQMENQFDGEKRAKLSKADANAQYPGMHFEEDVYPEIARLRYDEKLKTDNWQKYIERGPETGLGFDLSVGLAQGLTDPTNYVAGMVSGAAFKAAKIAPTVSKIFAANFAENLVTQIPNIPQLKREGRTDVGYGDAAVGAAIGALVGTGVHMGAERIRTKLEQAKLVSDINAKTRELEVRAMPEETRQKGARIALAQAESGQKLDVSTVHAEAQTRMAGDVKTGVQENYNFVPLDKPDGRLFYAVTDAKDGQASNWGKQYGDAVYLTDKEQAARNLGDAHVVQVPEDVRLADLSASVMDESPDSKIVRKVIEDVTGEKLDVEGVTTLGDLLEKVQKMVEADHLPDGVHDEIAMRLQSAGIDGFKSIFDVNGEPKHNVITLFDATKGEPTGFIPYDESIVPTRDVSDVAADLQNPEKSVANYPGIDEDIRAARAETAHIETDKMAALKREESQALTYIKQTQESLKIKAEGEKLTPGQKRVQDHLAAQLELIDQAHAKELAENKDAKALADCVFRGLV